MSNTDIKIKFDCNGSSTSAYSCSKSGDNSGVYVQSTDYDALLEQNKALKGLLSEAVDYLHSEVDTVIAEDLRNSIAELLEQAK